MLIILLSAMAAFAFILLMRVLWARNQPKVSTTLVIAASTVLVGALVFLTATGRFHPLAAAGTALLPFLRKGLFLFRLSPLVSSAFRMFQSTNPSFDSSSTTRDRPQVSEAETDELKMTLNHQTGEISGTVKFGEFRGRDLSTLSAVEIVRLYRSLEDEQSRRLMVSYIERYHPDLDQAEDTAEPPTHDDTMTVKNAREVLGVHEDASEKDVINAHRRMIQHLHPDRGGSSFLAAQINEAKRVLLDYMK